MRETLEMVIVSRVQNMVPIRKKNAHFVTNLSFLFLWKSFFGALGVESPHGGAMVEEMFLNADADGSIGAEEWLTGLRKIPELCVALESALDLDTGRVNPLMFESG